MAQELIYTSAERGLRPGTRGFCTVAYTRGMRPQTIQMLEALSAYKSIYAVHDARTAISPPAVSHYRLTVTGTSLNVLSRVAPTQADHTGRSNKMAHHVLLHTHERIPAGPAALASSPQFFMETWEGPPRHLEEEKTIPEDCGLADVHAVQWEALAGDAGWAGVLASTVLNPTVVPAFLIFAPGMDVLPLIDEALALLSPERRWQVTFSTYFNSLPAQATCLWRCCVPDSEALREARRNPRALVIDLTQPLGAAKESPLVTRARTGGPPPREEEKPAEKETETRAFVLLRHRGRPGPGRPRP